jgi:hypothetical protein
MPAGGAAGSAAAGSGASTLGAGAAAIGGALAPIAGGATPSIVPFIAGRAATGIGAAAGSAAGAAGAGVGPAAGAGAAPGRIPASPPGGWFIISMVPLNFGAVAPFSLKPHLLQVVELSGFWVPQFGQKATRNLRFPLGPPSRAPEAYNPSWPNLKRIGKWLLFRGFGPASPAPVSALDTLVCGSLRFVAPEALGACAPAGLASTGADRQE